MKLLLNNELFCQIGWKCLFLPQIIEWPTIDSKGYPQTTNNFPIFAVEHTKCNFLTKNDIFSPELKCSTETILHHPVLNSAHFCHLEMLKKLHAVLISIFLYFSGVILQDYMSP